VRPSSLPLFFASPGIPLLSNIISTRVLPPSPRRPEVPSGPISSRVVADPVSPRFFFWPSRISRVEMMGFPPRAPGGFTTPGKKLFYTASGVNRAYPYMFGFWGWVTCVTPSPKLSWGGCIIKYPLCWAFLYTIFLFFFFFYLFSKLFVYIHYQGCWMLQ
jgi:hypothetical protein